MGVERDAAWYDRHWASKRRHKPSSLALQPHYPLWSAVKAWAVARQRSIVDLGCGTGPIAQLVAKDERFVGLYLGIDFSEVALSIARKKIDGTRFSFLRANLTHHESRDLWAELHDRAFLVCEVLEHIEDDCALILTIPQGAPTLLSVPTFDAAAHVRHFNTADEVRARYGKLFDRLNIRAVHVITERPSWFICTGCVVGPPHG